MGNFPNPFKRIYRDDLDLPKSSSKKSLKAPSNSGKPVKAPSNPKKQKLDVNPEVDSSAVIDQDATISSLSVPQELINHCKTSIPASTPGQTEEPYPVHDQEKLNEAAQINRDIHFENTQQKQLILSLQAELTMYKFSYSELLKAHKAHMPCDSDLRQEIHYLKCNYEKAVQDLNNATRNYNKLAATHQMTLQKYDQMDTNYMAAVTSTNLEVTNDDHGSITTRLNTLTSKIQSLLAKCKGNDSTNLKRIETIQRLRDFKMLQDFPVQEILLETYHLNLFIESAFAKILMDRLFRNPLKGVFDQGRQFDAICSWVERQGSPAARLWRQQLCLLTSENVELRANWKSTAVDATATDLMALISQVYSNVDNLQISENIHAL
ncbi:hypothetical protein BGX28_010412, partial [Mortierella sp. GBA30]